MIIKKIKFTRKFLGYSLAIAGTIFLMLTVTAYMASTRDAIRNNSPENKLLSIVQIGAMAEVPPAVVEHANIGFVLDNFLVDPSPDNSESGDEHFANVISQCTFHSEEDFDPLCVICKLVDSDGNILAQGSVGEPFDQAYVGSSSISINVEPVIENSISNDVQLVHGVQVTVCSPPGGQGCTPGYWRQEQHFGSWTNPPYSPIHAMTTFRTAFDLQDLASTITINTHPDGGKPESKSDTFGNPSDDITLLDAVWAAGGDQNKLARHATAALLNAANPNVNFDPLLPQSEIIRLVQVAYGKITDNNQTTIAI